VGVRSTALVAALICLFVAAPAFAQSAGEDYISSPNVTLLKRVRTAGDGVGARVVGNYLYVTSTKDLEIFDITNPEDPQMVGTLTANVEFENEEVPTNGKILGISGQTPTLNAGGFCPSTYPATSSGCLAIYDVRDKAAPKLLTNVLGAGDHTSACVLDCSYFYGSSGTVTDARTVLDNGQAKIIGNWYDSPTIPDANGPDKTGKFVRSCHHVQEVAPGILLGACQPILLMSVRPEDGGSILTPKVLAMGANADGRFIHGVHWPRGGQDKFLLVGGEHNFQPTCNPPPEAKIEIGAFMTWDASHARLDGKFAGPLDEWRPTNGAYLDSNPPSQILGCSAHWFDEHPSFHDGGLVAEAAYENGTRFFQIGSDGKITEQGYFVPLGGATSAPHWAPSGDVVYAVDYERGLDVLKYTGPHYVPGEAETGTPGTAGAQPAGSGGPSVCKAGAGFSSVSVRPVPHQHAKGAADHSDEGPGPGLEFVVSRREKRPFGVQVVQQARGRHLVRNHLVASFTGKTKTFAWDGAGAIDGWYVVRVRMRLAGGGADIRRISLHRRGGKFVNRPASYLKNPCGALSVFKLQRPVFGGNRNRALKITYKLPRGVDKVQVVARAHGRVLKRFKNSGTRGGRTYQLLLPARGIKRGTDVRVRLTVTRAGSGQTTTLVSRRI
jgi:hypothetical protein